MQPNDHWQAQCPNLEAENPGAVQGLNPGPLSNIPAILPLSYTTPTKYNIKDSFYCK